MGDDVPKLELGFRVSQPESVQVLQLLRQVKRSFILIPFPGWSLADEGVVTGVEQRGREEK